MCIRVEQERIFGKKEGALECTYDGNKIPDTLVWSQLKLRMVLLGNYELIWGVNDKNHKHDARMMAR